MLAPTSFPPIFPLCLGKETAEQAAGVLPSPPSSPRAQTSLQSISVSLSPPWSKLSTFRVRAPPLSVKLGPPPPPSPARRCYTAPSCPRYHQAPKRGWANPLEGPPCERSHRRALEFAGAPPFFRRHRRPTTRVRHGALSLARHTRHWPRVP
jgi:hypothetical protein